jgi:hypothetical protein
MLNRLEMSLACPRCSAAARTLAMARRQRRDNARLYEYLQDRVA